MTNLNTDPSHANTHSPKDTKTHSHRLGYWPTILPISAQTGLSLWLTWLGHHSQAPLGRAIDSISVMAETSQPYPNRDLGQGSKPSHNWDIPDIPFGTSQPVVTVGTVC